MNFYKRIRVRRGQIYRAPGVEGRDKSGPYARYMSVLDGELTITHDDSSIYFDGTTIGDDIYMDLRIPIGTCELWIRVAKGHMETRHLFVLEQIPDQLFEAGECADSKFPGPIAIGHGEEVVAQIFCDRGILAGDFCNIALLYSDDDRLFQDTIFL